MPSATDDALVMRITAAKVSHAKLVFFMPRTPSWVWEMHKQFFRYAIPFSFGRRPSRRHRPDIHVGTCVAIQFEDLQFLVSASHVVKPALEAVEHEGAECLAGNVLLDLQAGAVSRSDVLDVATVRLPPQVIGALEDDGYLIVRPTKWPPPELALEDPVLAAGFPGAWRRNVAWDTLDVPGTTKLGLIHQIRHHEFALQLDPAFVDQYSIEHGELSEDSLPGMSGGPALLVRHDETVLTPRLCGVLKQGWALGDGNRLLYFARLTQVRKDGVVLEADV